MRKYSIAEIVHVRQIPLICFMGDAWQIRDQEGLYFLTFQVVGWADVFTRPIYRDLLIGSFKYCIEKKGLELFAYVIMTNHVHVIVRAQNGDLSKVVGDFKRHTSKQVFKAIAENDKESRKSWLEMIFKYHAKYNKRVADRQFWTHENHAVGLINNDMIETRLKYIHDNPVRAGWVEKPEDYLYSSARNYAGLPGLLSVVFV